MEKHQDVWVVTEDDLEGMYTRAQAAWENIARENVELFPPPDWSDVIAFFPSLEAESDRAVPVLAFAYIDTEIERQLRVALNPAVSSNDLFSPLGPLGAASTRITVGHALYWLTDDSANDLHVLRRIRNKFAHDRMPDGFDDRYVVETLMTHRMLPQLLTALFPIEKNPWVGSDPRAAFTVRDQFVMAAAFTAWTVMAQLYVAPTAMRTGVSPAALLNPESGSAPAAIVKQRELFKTFIDSVLRPAADRSQVITDFLNELSPFPTPDPPGGV